MIFGGEKVLRRFKIWSGRRGAVICAFFRPSPKSGKLRLEIFFAGLGFRSVKVSKILSAVSALSQKYVALFSRFFRALVLKGENLKVYYKFVVQINL